LGGSALPPLPSHALVAHHASYANALVAPLIADHSYVHALVAHHASYANTVVAPLIADHFYVHALVAPLIADYLMLI